MAKKRKRVLAATAAVALARSRGLWWQRQRQRQLGGDGRAARPAARSTTSSSAHRARRPPADLRRSRHRQLPPDRLPPAGGVPDLDRPRRRNTPVPDLATDTGTSSDGGKNWSFTLKDGIKWEDGKPITCEDFKYGASRVFATDIITGGPNYLLSYLDIPKDPKTGLPAYNGPYKGEGQAASTRRSPATARPSRTTSTSRGRTSRSPSRRCT